MIQVVLNSGQAYEIDADGHSVEEDVLNVTKSDKIVARFKWANVQAVIEGGQDAAHQA